MNDPNGMVYMDGDITVFPVQSLWYALAEYALGTCREYGFGFVDFTHTAGSDSLGAIFGSAVIDVHTAGFGENAMIAIYTSAGKEQTQSIAYSTDKGGLHQYEGNRNPNPEFLIFVIQ